MPRSATQRSSRNCRLVLEVLDKVNREIGTTVAVITRSAGSRQGGL